VEIIGRRTLLKGLAGSTLVPAGREGESFELRYRRGDEIRTTRIALRPFL
jgi:hypothetical protein